MHEYYNHVIQCVEKCDSCVLHGRWTWSRKDVMPRRQHGERDEPEDRFR
jgi:hypothetical protein